MAVNLLKNKDALLKAYNDVVAENNDIDWAVFGYEGQTPVLKVVETGEGTIDDLVDELNSSKIMYAYCKVLDPNTSLPKYVFINWQGEAAQEGMKFKCASHLREISAMFRPIHATVNARNEDDMDEKSIVDKVAKSSGSQYSIHKEKPKTAEPITAVGSVYKKTQITKEISIKQRDKFWSESEHEEQRRLTDERRQMLVREQSLDQERKDREVNEGAERDRKIQERMRQVGQQKASERRASQTDTEEQRRKWEREQKQAHDEEEERRRRTDDVRKQRAAEAHTLTSSSTSQARALFRRKESESGDYPETASAPRKRPIELPRGQPSPPPTQQYREPSPPPRQPSPPRRQPSPPRRQPSPPRRQPSPPRRQPSPPRRQPSPPRRQPSPPRRQPSPPPREPSPPPREPSPPHRQPSPPRRDPSPPPRQPSPEPIPAQQAPKTRNLLAEVLPQRQPDSDDEQEETWEDEDTQNVPAVQATHIPEPEPEPEPIQQEVPREEPAEEPTEVPTLGPEYGKCVRALYDYQAADDTEINFDPDDIITQVEMIDEGWWTGVGPDGKQGMFPANFVELIQ